MTNTTPIYDEQILSDLHKEAYGFRPREYFWDSWKAMSIEQRNDEWNSMIEDAERSIEAENAHYDQALKSFEVLVLANVALGAKDEETAIRWLLDSMDEQGFNGDPEYVCYLLGLRCSEAHRFKFYFQGG